VTAASPLLPDELLDKQFYSENLWENIEIGVASPPDD
jgi:hypothetical protein